jgi:hypothetical protein
MVQLNDMEVAAMSMASLSLNLDLNLDKGE